MPNPEAQLKKLEQVLGILETDRASTDEVAAAFEAVLGVIKQLKDTIDRDMASNKGEMDDLYAGVLKEIKVIEQRMVKMSDRLESKIEVDNSLLQKQLLTEVKGIRDLIPQMPDLTVLENRIDAVESLIPKIPDEITPIQVRDKLETLNGEERLDVRAVNNAPKMTVSLSAPPNPEVGDLWGQP